MSTVLFPHARVLFQGDSITDGNRGRTADPNHILGHGYAFLIAARFGDELARLDLTFMNRGISGNTVADLDKRWQNDTIDLKPDVLSILVGVNDLNRGVPAHEYEAQYDALLRRTREALPNVKLILIEPFGLPTGKKAADWATYEPALAAYRAAVARLALKYGASLISAQQALNDACVRAPAEHWLWDGVHPTYSGHYVLARAWWSIHAE